MDGNADLGNMMTERFNVGGAMLLKLFGRRGEEDALFGTKAATVRDLGIRISLVTRVFARQHDDGAGAGDRAGLRRRRPPRRQRRPHGRHGARAGDPAAAAARPAPGPLQRAHRRDDRAGQLRAGLRGARPAVADPGEAGRRRRAGRRLAASSSTTSRSPTPGPTRSRWPPWRRSRAPSPATLGPGAARHLVLGRAGPDGGAGRARRAPARPRSPTSWPGSTT